MLKLLPFEVVERYRDAYRRCGGWTHKRRFHPGTVLEGARPVSYPGFPPTLPGSDPGASAPSGVPPATHPRHTFGQTALAHAHGGEKHQPGCLGLAAAYKTVGAHMDYGHGPRPRVCWWGCQRTALDERNQR
jgi:hypothetical protein